ncbi:MAG TPA: hypothetical protein VF525_06005 [Pyrinomonadaceae bacterium]|jgi:hypothetical protein
MRFRAINLKRLSSLLLLGATLLCGAGGATYAQGRYDHEGRKAAHRELKEHQKFERRELRERLRSERRVYNNDRNWRDQRRSERTALKQHQRAERLMFRQRYNPGRHLGRGYTRAPGQRIYINRRVRSRFNR